jgi:hypothetical protein
MEGKGNPYQNGPYIVLSDRSTFCADVENAIVAYVSDGGQEKLEGCGDFKAVGNEEAEYVTLKDLMDAYEKLHGVTL